MQREIDELKRELHHTWRKRLSPNSELSSEETNGASYRQRSKTLPNESFSYDKEYHHRRRYKSPLCKGLGNEAMSKALSQIFKPPFTQNIEDPEEHVSHFNQRMAVHSKDEALMCKVFPSSLGLMVMRWFDGLRANSIDSFKKLTRAFSARFITCSRVSRPLGSLLSMFMGKGETLKTYSDKYWEMFNEIDRDYDDVAISTFKAGLPTEHDLRKSLAGKPVTSVRQLMDRIDKSDRYNNNRPRKDFVGQPGSTNTQVVNVVFREPVQQVLEKIKNESFFKWPNKMAGDPMRCNQSLYCQYHQDHGHTIDDCRNLWDHLDQLVQEGKLKQLLHHSSGQGSQTSLEFRGDDSSRLPLGTINVIFVAPGRTESCPSRVMSVSRYPVEESSSMPKRVKIDIPLVSGFSDEDKLGTIQPHDDALVVTLRIGGYDVKRVMID
ncbi:uncharacterized protein LOC115990146 [Quercus lobata]|uniref:uncharacterized protein LOC115990146 n=1 Tax=Quercus lobata TaxID=97700 RepID=UPI0012454CFE|nr:uncharacterized protein LOC115990146 [Quercus lobata]